jgi:hypothetical protein
MRVRTALKVKLTVDDDRRNLRQRSVAMMETTVQSLGMIFEVINERVLKKKTRVMLNLTTVMM